MRRQRGGSAPKKSATAVEDRIAACKGKAPNLEIRTEEPERQEEAMQWRYQDHEGQQDLGGTHAAW